MNIVLLGPPGSGKGTQAVRVAQARGLEHISTGEIFREEIASKSDLGKQVESYVKTGKLVPDSLVVQVVEHKLDSLERDFLLDGFPRTVDQAEALARYMKAKGKQLDAVVYLNVRVQELIQRLSGRQKEANRADDQPAVIQQRLMVYEDLTRPLIAYYRTTENFHEVDGKGTVDEVFEQVQKVLSTSEVQGA